jgi:branched-chain amino acid transport system ATP-binding protein
MSDTPLLRVKDLTINYGGIAAVRSAHLEVMQGELVALIGSNGAGKTTTMKAIVGLKDAAGGTIEFDGRAIRGKAPDALLKLGLALVPEGRGIFARMTVLENLQMGAYLRDDRDGIERDMERMFGFFPRLKERALQYAGTMSGGEQQMLALSRCLLSQPRLLLLDEPSMGLSPIMVGTIFDVIKQIARDGMTVLLVEQNAKLALRAANRGYVMDSGSILMSGPADQLLQDRRVQQAYLGV